MAVEIVQLPFINVPCDKEYLDDVPSWDDARHTLVSKLLKRFNATGDLLDIGCGPGVVWAGFRGRGYAVDRNPDEVRTAREKGINAICANAQDLPFESSRFGVVLMLDILEHMKDPDLALKEARRVLNSSGILIASVPLHPGLWSKFDESVGHVHRYRSRELDALLKRDGFEVHYRTCWNLLGLPGALLRKAGIDVRGASRIAGPLIGWDAWLAARVSLPLGLTEFCVVGKLGPIRC
jgi:SAM-dependent methyltransferase